MSASFMYQTWLFAMDNGATSFVFYKTHAFLISYFLCKYVADGRTAKSVSRVQINTGDNCLKVFLAWDVLFVCEIFFAVCFNVYFLFYKYFRVVFLCCFGCNLLGGVHGWVANVLGLFFVHLTSSLSLLLFCLLPLLLLLCFRSVLLVLIVTRSSASAVTGKR